MTCSILTATNRKNNNKMLHFTEGADMRFMEFEEIEEIVITAPANTGAWREGDRFYPVDWHIQILTNKKTRLGLSRIRKLASGKVLNMSTEGVAYRMYKPVAATPGDRILIQLDKCETGLASVQYKAVIEVVRICDSEVICARFAHAPWDLIDAIESDLQDTR